jgi:catalase
MQVNAFALWRFLIALRTRHACLFEPAYHGVQTFWLVKTHDQEDRSGLKATPMRYRWLPVSGDGPVSHSSPRSFLLELTIRSSDAPHGELINPSRRWPPDCERMIAGRLDLLEALPGDDRNLAFNPIVLAPGIEPSDDDIFAGRRGAYAVSHLRRSPHVSDRLHPR